MGTEAWGGSQNRLALHKTVSPLLTSQGLDICKRHQVENSTFVGGGQAWHKSTQRMALFSQTENKGLIGVRKPEGVPALGSQGISLLRS